MSLLCVVSWGLVDCGGYEFKDGKDGTGGEASLGGGDNSASGGATGGQHQQEGGAASGGETSLGGAASGGDTGSGGEDGSGGAATVTPIYVKCGSVAQCPVHEGGQCCYLQATDEHVCQAAGSSCETSGSGPYVVRRSYTCDERADCPTGQFCCYTGSNATPAGAAGCAETCPPPLSAPRLQICNPANTAPSDCQSGTCTGDASTYVGDLKYCK